MKKGTISRVVDYYRDHPKYRRENDWAWRDFFGAGYRPTEQEFSWFIEWYVFEFRLASGRTVLQELVHDNPLNDSPEELETYRALSKAEFGMHEVLRIDLGQGLRLRNLHTGEEIEVTERSGTYQLKVGQMMFARVAWFGDHNELVGSDMPGFDMRIGDGLREHFLQLNEKLSVRDVLSIMQNLESALEFSQLEEKHIDPKKAKEKFAAALRKTNLDQYVDVDTVRQWIVRTDRDSEFLPITMLLGLLPPDVSERNLDRIMDSLNDFMNVTPRDSLKGRNPQEVAQDNPNREPDYLNDRIVFGLGCCGDQMDNAQLLMRDSKFRLAAREFSQVFEQLLRHRSTLHELYRPYANKALSHYYAGEHVLGDTMLGIALTLNPNYDFGIDLATKAEVEPNELREIISSYSTRRPPKSVARDAGYRYYQFLEPFGINFTTSKLTKTPLSVFKIKA